MEEKMRRNAEQIQLRATSDEIKRVDVKLRQLIDEKVTMARITVSSYEKVTMARITVSSYRGRLR